MCVFPIIPWRKYDSQRLLFGGGLSGTNSGGRFAPGRFCSLPIEVWGGSEANFLEVCFGRIPCGNFHTKTTSKKSRPPSGNFLPNPPELPRSPSRSFSSREAGRKIVLVQTPSRPKVLREVPARNGVLEEVLVFLATCSYKRHNAQALFRAPPLSTPFRLAPPRALLGG